MPADVALCSMATAHSASDARIFALSVQAFEPSRHLYLGADASGAAAVRSAWTLPEAQLHVVAVPSEFQGRDRERLKRYGKWTAFQMLKADLLRRALSDGHAAALFLDCDILLLAPLPPMGDAPLGLSLQRTNARMSTLYGRYNGGCVFVREAAVLDAWSRASRNTSYHPCCRDQVALDQLALEFRHFEIDRNFNVGWYELTRTHSHDGLDHTDEIRCDNGALVYAGGRPLLSLHMHISTESSLTIEKRSASHILPKIRAQLAACSSAIPSTLHSTLGLQTRAAPAVPSSHPSPSHPPSPPLSAAEQRTPCIAVMAFDRPQSLEALLGHLNGMDYGPSKGSVVLRIGIDFPEDGAPQAEKS